MNLSTTPAADRSMGRISGQISKLKEPYHAKVKARR
jgi:hypothetical protein